jgi:hypothetical protein
MKISKHEGHKVSQRKKNGSLGFAVVLATYGGGFCDFPKNRPHIWGYHGNSQ